MLLQAKRRSFDCASHDKTMRGFAQDDKPIPVSNFQLPTKRAKPLLVDRTARCGSSVEEIKERMTQTKANVHRVFHALGDPTRRRIVEQLSERPYSVSQLAIPLAMTVAAVIQHLQILEESGLVRTAKLGRVRTCQIEPSGLAVMEQWISERRTMWERRFDRLGDLLAEPEDSQGDT